MTSGTRLRMSMEDNNNLKRNILIELLLFSNNLFSQTISLSDLIDNWKWGSGSKQYTVITSKSDSIYPKL